ncbi:hypothetical protein LEP1GSC040_3943 [Leptospira santarosai str. 2000030832]|nr:hypothetical protein LEP1GSC040_3943 [Leptospira santarosai str. 2000030832]
MNLKKTFIRFKCNDFKSNFRLKTSVFGRSSPNEKTHFIGSPKTTSEIVFRKRRVCFENSLPNL